MTAGRMHGMAFRYQICPRHSFSDYTATVYPHGGKIYMPTQGACTGMFATDAVAMVVAEELGAVFTESNSGYGPLFQIRKSSGNV
jgi:hypothetical protein